MVFDEVDIDSSPARPMLLILSAYDRDGPLKGAHTQTYHGKSASIQNMVSVIAKRCGLEPRVDSRVASINLEHREQDMQSDQSFLTTLADDIGCIFKPREGKAIMAHYPVVSPLPISRSTNQIVTLGNIRAPVARITTDYVTCSRDDARSIMRKRK